MKTGDLVRYTPEGKVVERWADWYGLIIKQSKADFMTVVRWNKDGGSTLSIRKADLTVVNESQ
tara:strand:- start:44 stop:232 length:189 start_codon:yes stop_codon:yes gene_type:complete